MGRAANRRKVWQDMVSPHCLGAARETWGEITPVITGVVAETRSPTSRRKTRGSGIPAGRSVAQGAPDLSDNNPRDLGAGNGDPRRAGQSVRDRGQGIRRDGEL